MTIGAHTANHLSLPDQSATVREEEVQASVDALAALLGHRVGGVAYPYGAHDPAVADLVRRRWDWGLTCDPRRIADSFDAARVPRLDVKPWDVDTLAARVLELFETDGRPIAEASTLP